MPKFPNIVYKCLFIFKGGYAIEMDTLRWYGSCFIDTKLRSILLYVYKRLLMDSASHLVKKLFLCRLFDGMLCELDMQDAQRNDC